MFALAIPLALEGAGTLTNILTDIGEFFTAAWGWVSTVASTVASTPLLLIFAIVPLVGLGVGLFKRILH